MCPAHVAKSHFTDIAVSGRFPYQSNERDVHDALERKFEGTSMETCDDYDLWSCIQKDFTTNAKKIVQVFMDYIQPKCKEFSNNEK